MHRERGVHPEALPYPSRRGIHLRVRIAAVGAAALLILLEALLAARIPDQPYSGIILNDLTVARVAAGSPAATVGIVKGDQVTSIDGRPCITGKNVADCLERLRPDAAVSYGIRRDDRDMTVTLKLASLPPPETLRRLSLLAVGFSFIAIGLLVYFRRHDKVALVFYLLSLAFGLVLTNIVTLEVGSASPLHRYALNDLMVLFLPALFLHFFLIFPARASVLEKHMWLEYALYLPAVLMFGMSVYFNVMIFSAGKALGDLITVFRNLTALYFTVFVVMGLIAFFRGYRSVSSDSFKSKLRLVLWGTIIGTLPLVFVRVVLSIQPALEIPGEKLVFLPLILVPVAFGHAIVRYGLLDLEIVVKRSLVYTLLIGVLASVYFLLVYGIGRVASAYMGSSDLFFSIVSIFVITLLISPLRARIRAVVDRFVFRQEYNYRKVLKQISHSLAGMINLDSLVSYLAIRVAEVLDAGSVVVFLRDDRMAKHTARYGTGVGHAMLKGFDIDGPLCDYLSKAQMTLDVGRINSLGRKLPLSGPEAEALRQARAVLVVPFVFKSELLGFMTIGTRRCDEYYSSTDIELLETLCDQVSLAIENAGLYLQAVEKEKMEQELEVAREIQHRLLPKSLPEIPGLAVHAMNIPSKRVGGDYYDVIPLSDERIGLVIADVSGKGVPAALLMASLQSSLRAEARAGRPPSQVISALNTAIYEHTSGGTFVTIFYAVLDFAEAVITYCNAGQSPPIVISEGSPPRQLDNTDIVMGVDPEAAYGDTTIEIGRGDLLFLYTDGITDELDEGDEPYGEARLISKLLEIDDSELPEIVERIHDDVLRYTQGKPQDDLTVLAVRILTLRPCHHPGALAKSPKLA